MTENEIVVYDNTSIMPVVSSDDMLARYQTIVEIKDKVMEDGVHYGIIPGVKKPSLWKPGAEVLCTAFMLVPFFEELETPRLQELLQDNMVDTPFFMYRYRCTLSSRDGRYTVGSGIGSCNSWEKKYRYRNAELKCPICHQATVKISRKEPGFYCWAKIGGCGANFGPDVEAITSQETGQVANPDIAEVINTIDKMAQKRALIAATLVAVGASDFFTQDVEDLPQFNGESTPAPKAPAPPAGTQKARSGQRNSRSNPIARPWTPDKLQHQLRIKFGKNGKQGAISDDEKRNLAIRFNGWFGDFEEPDVARHALLFFLTGKASSTELTAAEANVLDEWSLTAEAISEARAVLRNEMGGDFTQPGQPDTLPF